MQIVTDSGIDLANAVIRQLGIHIVPLTITLGDRHFRAGVDIQPDVFYQLLRQSEQFPVKDKVKQRFDCHFLPDNSISPLVGAHTGPGVCGVAYAPTSAFEQIPT